MPPKTAQCEKFQSPTPGWGSTSGYASSVLDPQVQATVARTALFSSLPERAHAALTEGGQLRRFAPGEQLMHQGETGDSLFVILRGRVQVERTHPAMQE